MILTRQIILEEIKAGRIRIEPFCEENLGPASYDVTLDNKIRVFKSHIAEVDILDVAIDTSILEKITQKIEIQDYYPLRPGELVLGITKEKITLPEDICGWIQGRSRFARIGLMIHVSASFIQPRSSNKQVFEIYNASKNIIKLKSGIKIAQIIFERCEGKGKYKGVFSRQTKI